MIDIKPLSPKRFTHCLGVAKCCYDLAMLWGGDPMKAYLAGLFHDIARELPKEQLLSLAREHDYPIDQATLDAPILIHGAVSAIIAKENYHIIDDDILTSMERHTPVSYTHLYVYKRQSLPLHKKDWPSFPEYRR